MAWNSVRNSVLTGVRSGPSYERTAEILRELIQTDTGQPGGNEKRLTEKLEAFFTGEACCDRICHSEQRQSLLVRIDPRQDGGERTGGGLVLCGHLDTVACGDSRAWELPPLSGELRDGRMYGRGAADMKGGVTAMLLTAEYFLNRREELKRPIFFCFTADEENQGIGARALAEHPWMKEAAELLICEPTGSQIGCCEKGALWVRLTARGRSAHGSAPEKGVNALAQLVELCGMAEKAIRELWRVDRGSRHRLLEDETVSLTMLQGGEAANIIPDQAEAVLDIRTVPGSASHRELMRLIEELAGELERRIAGLGIEVEILNDRPPLEISACSPQAERMAQVLRDNGREARCIGISYYTDASLLIPQWQIPFLIVGPGEIRQMHCANESISIGEVREMAKIYMEYAERFCCGLKRKTRERKAGREDGQGI